MDPIMQAIHRARARLQVFRMLRYLAYGLSCGLIAALLLLLAARLWPIPFYQLAAAGLAVAGAAAGLATGLLHRIRVKEAAEAMDLASGSAERSDMMVTALSFAGNDSAAARWQRTQAAEYGRLFAAQMKTRLRRPKLTKWWAGCGGGLAVCLALVLLPSPMDDKLAQAAEQKQWVQEQQKKTEDLVKELETKKLDLTAKKPLDGHLKTLQKELDGTKDPDRALEQLEKTMKAMEQTAKQQEEKAQNLSELGRKMQQTPQLSSIGKSLEQKDQAAMKKALDQLKQQIRKLSPEEKEQLREALKKMAEEAGKKQDTKALQEALNKAEQALAGTDPSKLDEALKGLEEELAKAIAASQASSSQSDAASALAASLASQGLGLASQMTAAGMPVSDAWATGGAAEQLALADSAGMGEPSDSGGGDPSEPIDGAGQGNSPGQGSGNGSGSGSGSGAGQGGSGRGGSGQGPGGSGAGLGQGGRELVTTPREFAGKGNVQADKGPIQGGGGTVQKGGVAPGVEGASRPYEEVYKEYEAEAKKSLGRSDLPQQMQGLVEEYFTGINPNP
ncbi:phage tail tape measure protein [Paenibacillus cineris]|uniref:Phage tail tape measure protein n=1 Tax=Paenibacillus cineris TaxID=237530 RepID=A0ABQ4L6I9_9BACL|nr:phage tail tape measure protein [Paenibacillus cineris]GIO51906.1 hypothetical protein J21TS7_02240 [Paenibacillus cineris]